VLGPQPPLLPDLAAQQRNAPAGGGGRNGGRAGAPNQ